MYETDMKTADVDISLEGKSGVPANVGRDAEMPAVLLNF